MRPLHLVLIGPPGSGKSTLAERLVARWPLTPIATGKRLRAEIAAQTPIGRAIESLLEQGHFAPDSIIDQLMRTWLADLPSDQGFLLDGYPRSLSQAHTLIGMLEALERPLDAVVVLDLAEEAAIERMSGRRICEGGGESFTLHMRDSAAVARCSERGGVLVQRDDDRSEVIRERIRVYERETEPLIAFYSAAGLVYHVAAEGAPEGVTDRVVNLLTALR